MDGGSVDHHVMSAALNVDASKYPHPLFFSSAESFEKTWLRTQGQFWRSNSLVNPSHFSFPALSLLKRLGSGLKVNFGGNKVVQKSAQYQLKDLKRLSSGLSAGKRRTTPPPNFPNSLSGLNGGSHTQV